MWNSNKYIRGRKASWSQIVITLHLPPHIFLPDLLKDQKKDIAQVLFQTLLKNRPRTQKGYVQSPLLRFQEGLFLVGKGSSNNQAGNLGFWKRKKKVQHTSLITHASNFVGFSDPPSSSSGNTAILLTRSELSRLLLGLPVTAEDNEGIPWWASAAFLWVHLFYLKNSCKFHSCSQYIHVYMNISLFSPSPKLHESLKLQAGVTRLSCGLIFDLWPHTHGGDLMPTSWSEVNYNQGV